MVTRFFSAYSKACGRRIVWTFNFIFTQSTKTGHNCRYRGWSHTCHYFTERACTCNIHCLQIQSRPCFYGRVNSCFQIAITIVLHLYLNPAIVYSGRQKPFHFTAEPRPTIGDLHASFHTAPLQSVLRDISSITYWYLQNGYHKLKVKFTDLRKKKSTTLTISIFFFVPEESYPPISLLIFNLVQYK